jgi:class 3 adenylate cyclase
VTPRGAASAGTTCPACGVETPAEARFCPACGQRLLGGVEERRVVTVLFADLVDSTRLVTALDPEAARDLLTETFRRLAAEVRRFGGTLEKYIGDAIFAVFGFPTGHDDDAARGVRAALAMRDIVKTAKTALGDLPLHLRIGLDTGEVAAGAGSGDLRVTGPAVHTAARIQQAAEPDQILLSARTLRAARDTAEVGQPSLLEVRGQRQPVEVVEVLGLSPTEPATDPMVGREADLPRLVGALDHAAHHNRLVLLVGDAGVGKSTLARAATAEIGDRVHVLWGRCLPDWQSLPFWPVREVLAAAAGMAATEPAGVLSSSIGQLVAQTWPDPLAAPATAEALCRLAGLELDEPGPAAQPGLGDTRELAAALAGVLCGLARNERVLVVLEDLHWATPDLLEVASTLVSDGCRSQGQLAYLGISRPELPGLPAWLLRTGTQRIDLDPLGEAAYPRPAPGAGRGPARPAAPLDQAGPVPGRRRRQVVLPRRHGRHGPAGRRRARRRPGPAGRDGPDRAAARAPGRRPGTVRLPPRPVPGRRLRHPAQGRPVRAPPPAGRLAGRHPRRGAEPARGGRLPPGPGGPAGRRGPGPDHRGPGAGGARRGRLPAGRPATARPGGPGRGRRGAR